MSREPLYEEIADDSDRLRSLYWEKEWTLDEIADEYDVSETTISKAFEAAGIEKRGRGGGSREPSLHERIATENGTELRRLYEQDLLSIGELMDHFDCSRKTIYRALDAADIERRSLAERVADRSDLEELYVEQHLSTYKIADGIGCGPETVRSALEIAGISRRREGWQIENPTVPTPIDASDAAYLAGLIDGEGHLSLVEDSDYRGGKCASLWVKMGNESVIRWLKETFGGTVRHEPRDGLVDMWKWDPNRILDIRTVLAATSPYLKHKTSEATDISEYIDEHYTPQSAACATDPEDVLASRSSADHRRQYFAGILDGEGNIGVYGAGDGYYNPRISVNMGSKRVVTWLRENFGGEFYHRPRDDPHSDMWNWMVQSQDEVEDLLTWVEPSMQVRDTAARDVIQFLETGNLPE